jgi:5-methylcytosine-specific restriction protein A
VASAAFRGIADDLLEWLAGDPQASLMLDSPSQLFVAEPPASPISSVSLLPMGADETKRKLTSHYRIDRSRAIRRAKIEEFSCQYGAVYCENCAFDFFQRYGERGRDFIEVHHKIPLAALLPNVVTYLSDLLLLCSNCHRMVHRRRPNLSPQELSDITISD